MPTIFPFLTVIHPGEVQSGSNILLPFTINSSSASAMSSVVRNPGSQDLHEWLEGKLEIGSMER